MHELAFGITGINHAFGTPINPKYPELIPGGSSSGSAAAVAAKQADFTLGQTPVALSVCPLHAVEFMV